MQQVKGILSTSQSGQIPLLFIRERDKELVVINCHLQLEFHSEFAAEAKVKRFISVVSLKKNWGRICENLLLVLIYTSKI